MGHWADAATDSGIEELIAENVALRNEVAWLTKRRDQMQADLSALRKELHDARQQGGKDDGRERI